MKYQQYRLGRSFDIALDPGEDIVPALIDLCQSEGVKLGLVSAGLGGFGDFRLSFPQADGWRAEKSWSGTVLQLSAVGGFLLNGSVETGATVTVDGTLPLTWTGRIEEGCARKFYCEMLVSELLPAGAET